LQKGTDHCDLILSLRAERSNLSLINEQYIRNTKWGNYFDKRPIAMTWCSYGTIKSPLTKGVKGVVENLQNMSA
ncbi:MAG: hypothetical protein U0586_16745, partial [Candidatus Brocadiaceae bacterium]